MILCKRKFTKKMSNFNLTLAILILITCLAQTYGASRWHEANGHHSRWTRNGRSHFNYTDYMRHQHHRYNSVRHHEISNTTSATPDIGTTDFNVSVSSTTIRPRYAIKSTTLGPDGHKLRHSSHNHSSAMHAKNNVQLKSLESSKKLTWDEFVQLKMKNQSVNSAHRRHSHHHNNSHHLKTHKNNMEKVRPLHVNGSVLLTRRQRFFDNEYENDKVTNTWKAYRKNLLKKLSTTSTTTTTAPPPRIRHSHDVLKQRGGLKELTGARKKYSLDESNSDSLTDSDYDDFFESDNINLDNRKLEKQPERSTNRKFVLKNSDSGNNDYDKFEKNGNKNRNDDENDNGNDDSSDVGDDDAGISSAEAVLDQKRKQRHEVSTILSFYLF